MSSSEQKQSKFTVESRKPLLVRFFTLYNKFRLPKQEATLHVLPIFRVDKWSDECGGAHQK